MSTDLCLYEVRDGVALVALNRPERNNGMTGALELAYFARLAEAADDREARAHAVAGRWWARAGRRRRCRSSS